MIVALMFTLAFTIATGRQRVIEALRRSAPRVRRAGGAILIVIGTWLALLGIFAGTFMRLLPV